MLVSSYYCSVIEMNEEVFVSVVNGYCCFSEMLYEIECCLKDVFVGLDIVLDSKIVVCVIEFEDVMCDDFNMFKVVVLLFGLIGELNIVFNVGLVGCDILECVCDVYCSFGGDVLGFFVEIGSVVLVV